MSEQTQSPGASGSSSKPPEEKKPRARVWRACEVCRKRKIKCDGQEPCMYCLSSGKQCSFKEINDNAAGARQYTVSVEARLVKLEDTVQRLLPMAQAFETWLRSSGSKSDLPFLLAPTDVSPSPIVKTDPNPQLPSRSPYRPSSTILQLARQPNASVQSPETDIIEDDIIEGNEKWSDRVSQLTKDSYGNLRYVGGPSSLMLVEALSSLQDSSQTDASPQSMSSLGARASVDLELPFFIRGKHFRKQELLPRAEDITYPRAELADELVAMYFQKIHTTFPILHQQTFLKQYQEAMAQVHKGEPPTNAPFLSCMFAVFACASGLVKRQRQSVENMPDTDYFSGVEFYERAQVLCWISTGLSQIEQVQCFALLAICNASWNTLAASWINAGQAVRRAQDLGLHRSPRRQRLTAMAKEIRRRVWWCVYSLDRVLSIALGRPSCAHDEDCSVEMPAELDDFQLLSLRDGEIRSPTGNSYMTGFVALLGIYIIAGKVMRFASSTRHDKTRDHQSDPELLATLQALDEELNAWLVGLPQSVRDSANDRSKPDMVALCLIAFFICYSAIINLHRPFIPDHPSRPEELNSLRRCLSAARSCIHIGEMTKEMLPTSHHLAFAVQYITISGVLLLRCITYINEASLVSAIIADAEKCIKILDALEEKWPSSRRCCEIVSDLLVVVKTRLHGGPAALEGLQQHREPVPNGKRKRAEDAEASIPPESRRRRSAGSSASWNGQMSPPAPPNMPGTALPRPSPTNAPVAQHYGHQMYPAPSIQQQRTSNLRTSVDMSHQMRPPSSNVPAHDIYQNIPGAHMVDSRISLDLNALSAGQEVAGLPYSGFDFLGNDVYALIRSVEQPHPPVPNEQMLQQNAQLLWQAYGEGSIPFGERTS